MGQCYILVDAWKMMKFQQWFKWYTCLWQYDSAFMSRKWMHHSQVFHHQQACRTTKSNMSSLLMTCYLKDLTTILRSALVSPPVKGQMENKHISLDTTWTFRYINFYGSVQKQIKLHSNKCKFLLKSIYILKKYNWIFKKYIQCLESMFQINIHINNLKYKLWLMIKLVISLKWELKPRTYLHVLHHKTFGHILIINKVSILQPFPHLRL